MRTCHYHEVVCKLTLLTRTGKLSLKGDFYFFVRSFTFISALPLYFFSYSRKFKVFLLLLDYFWELLIWDSHSVWFACRKFYRICIYYQHFTTWAWDLDPMDLNLFSIWKYSRNYRDIGHAIQCLRSHKLFMCVSEHFLHSRIYPKTYSCWHPLTPILILITGEI